MDLNALADSMQVTVRYTPRMSAWGRYDNPTRTVTLIDGMGVVQWRSTFAHELGHAHWEHEGTCPRGEKQADLFAVSVLIPPALWIDATGSADSLSTMAFELGVLPRLVRVAHELYRDITLSSL